MHFQPFTNRQIARIIAANLAGALLISAFVGPALLAIPDTMARVATARADAQENFVAVPRGMASRASLMAVR